MIVDDRYNNLFFILKEIFWHVSDPWTLKNFMGVAGSAIFVSLSVGSMFLIETFRILATSYSSGLVTMMSSNSVLM